MSGIGIKWGDIFSINKVKIPTPLVCRDQQRSDILVKLMASRIQGTHIPSGSSPHQPFSQFVDEISSSVSKTIYDRHRNALYTMWKLSQTSIPRAIIGCEWLWFPALSKRQQELPQPDGLSNISRSCFNIMIYQIWVI